MVLIVLIPPNHEKIYRKAVFSYLKNIDRKKLDQIKVIYGHLVHFGIDKFFKKKLRYFTFVRQPEKRIVSIYNDLRTLNSKNISIEQRNFINNVFLINNKVPSFKNWFNNKYLSQHWEKYLSISGYLQLHGFLSDSNYKKDNFTFLDSKFYYLGLVKNFSSDSLFLYEKMGINKYFLDENLSIKYKKLDEKDPIYRRLTRYTLKDRKLFKFIDELNMKYKIRFSNYKKIIEKKEKERMLLLPLTSFIFSPRRTIRNIIYMQLRK